MDAANVIALVGIAATAAVAITAQIFSYKKEERLQKESETRIVLDGALATAYEARSALDEYTRAVARLTTSEPGSHRFRHIESEVQTAQTAANAALDKFRLNASRLIVRFGPEHIVYAIYASVLLASFDVLGNTADFHTVFVQGSAGRKIESPVPTLEGIADGAKQLDRLVFEFAEQAYEWANRH